MTKNRAEYKACRLASVMTAEATARVARRPNTTRLDVGVIRYSQSEKRQFLQSKIPT